MWKRNKKKPTAAATKKSVATESGNNNKNNTNNNDNNINMTMNTGKWNREEKDLLDQSLMENGKDTSYEFMMSFVTTQKRSSIVSYYCNNKGDLLRKRKDSVYRQKEDLLRKENNLDCERDRELESDDRVNFLPVNGNDLVTEGDKRMDILAEAIKREKEVNDTVKHGPHEDLSKFVQSYFAVIKEKVLTEGKQVVVVNVGTFYQDNKGQMAVTYHPYPSNKKHE